MGIDQCCPQATFIAERATSIAADEVRTKSHTFVLEHPAIDATGFDMRQSVAGGLFEFGDGHCGVTANLTTEDESTRYVQTCHCDDERRVGVRVSRFLATCLIVMPVLT